MVTQLLHKSSAYFSLFLIKRKNIEKFIHRCHHLEWSMVLNPLLIIRKTKIYYFQIVVMSSVLYASLIHNQKFTILIRSSNMNDAVYMVLPFFAQTCSSNCKLNLHLLKSSVPSTIVYIPFAKQNWNLRKIRISNKFAFFVAHFRNFLCIFNLKLYSLTVLLYIFVMKFSWFFSHKKPESKFF